MEDKSEPWTFYSDKTQEQLANCREKKPTLQDEKKKSQEHALVLKIITFQIFQVVKGKA